MKTNYINEDKVDKQRIMETVRKDLCKVGCRFKSNKLYLLLPLSLRKLKGGTHNKNKKENRRLKIRRKQKIRGGGGVGESWRGLLTSPNPKPQKKSKVDSHKKIK